MDKYEFIFKFSLSTPYHIMIYNSMCYTNNLIGIDLASPMFNLIDNEQYEEVINIDEASRQTLMNADLMYIDRFTKKDIAKAVKNVGRVL